MAVKTVETIMKSFTKTLKELEKLRLHHIAQGDTKEVDVQKLRKEIEGHDKEAERIAKFEGKLADLLGV